MNITYLLGMVLFQCSIVYELPSVLDSFETMHEEPRLPYPATAIQFITTKSVKQQWLLQNALAYCVQGWIQDLKG